MKLYLTPTKDENSNIIVFPEYPNKLTLRVSNNLGIPKVELILTTLEAKELIYQLEENMKILHKKYYKAKDLEMKKIT